MLLTGRDNVSGTVIWNSIDLEYQIDIGLLNVSRSHPYVRMHAAVTDLDGDSCLDTVLLSSDGSLQTYRAHCTGLQRAAPVQAITKPIVSMGTADLDHDGTVGK